MSVHRIVAPVLVLAVLGGCASPVFKNVAPIAPMPSQAADTPERYSRAEVVWGGRILAVRNLVDTTEVEIIAYPIDHAQRPRLRGATQGRFIAMMPGYVEAFDYPIGRFVTVHGVLDGSRVKPVEEHEYVYPLVQAKAAHVWPATFPNDRAQWSLGIGIGF